MPSHHSHDYKLSAVRLYLKTKSLRRTCEAFECEKSSLERWIQRYLETGDVSDKKRSGRPRKVNSEIEQFIRREVRKQPTLTLLELVKAVRDEFGTLLHHTTVYHTLDKMGITRKRLRKHYYPEKKLETEKQDLTNYYRRVLSQDPNKIISIDETGIYLNMKPAYGRNYKGQRVVVRTHLYPFKKYNCLCAIKAGKVIACEVYPETEVGIGVEGLCKFIREHITRYSEHLILLDNASFHKSREVKKLISDINCEALYTVPYHPETNPIEEFFSQLKHYIKLESPQTYESIVRVVRDTVKTKVTRGHLGNYFKHLLYRAKAHIAR